MLAHTKGIVLRYIKLKETSIIAHIYTEEFGIQAYIINGIRSPKSKRGVGHFQPLNILDLVVYHHNQRDIHRISEWKTSTPLYSIFTDVKKSTLAMFISEVLYKAIKESEANSDTFQFIASSIEYLENLDQGLENFHLQFLVKLSKYLGFGTQNYHSNVSSEFELIFRALDQDQYGKHPKINQLNRRDVLDYLLLYYKEHSSGFGVLKSYPVLKEIFSN